MKSQTFTALIYKEENIYVGECVEVDTVDQSETIEEAIDNLKEATRLYLEEYTLPEVSAKFITSIEVDCA
ncbi:MAG: type II toxin-antitoxin system HicB family antitoxin [Oscillatoria sp. PMC 1068.18]|nr:type II toxin-antitoxin system HicB family antitoxin [Oscillatoria sp. PMC 1068.18]